MNYQIILNKYLLMIYIYTIFIDNYKRVEYNENE